MARVKRAEVDLKTGQFCPLKNDPGRFAAGTILLIVVSADGNGIFYGCEGIFFVDMVIEHDSVQMVDFVLEDDGNITAQPQFYVISVKISACHCNPCVSRYISGNVSVHG